MNYYEHHLGDYAQATAHLSMLEDAAYSRMLRWYYAEEKPLPADERAICRIVRAASKQERDAVKAVLGDFFELREDGYHQRRCDAELAAFRDKSGKAKRSAEARWSGHRSHTERNANASPNASNHDANAYANAMRTHAERMSNAMLPAGADGRVPQSPIPNPQNTNPPTPAKRGSGTVHRFPPGFEAFWSAYPRKTAKDSAAKAFAKLGAVDDALLARMLAAIEAQKASPQWAKDAGQFVPHPATWLNGRRWEDEATGPSDGSLFAGVK